MNQYWLLEDGVNRYLIRMALSSFAIICIALSTAAASRAAVVYLVTVDTASVAATAGNINFQLNPGGAAQFVSADISSFMFIGGGSLDGPPALIGNVTGVLPATVTLTTGPPASGLNDYFQLVTYGNKFSFVLSLYGPGVDAPDGVSTAGTTFGIALFNNALPFPNPILTTDPFGFAAIIDIAPGTGVITLTPFPTPGGPPAVTFDPIPEPATFLSMGSSLLAVMVLYRRRKRNS